MLRELYYLRIQKEITQRELAEKSGLSKSTITQIESGKSIPRIDTVCFLSSALDMSPVALFQLLIKGEDFYAQGHDK